MFVRRNSMALDEQFISINPYSQKLISSFNNHSSGELDRIIQNAQEQFHKWSQTDYTHRQSKILELANTLELTKQELSQNITNEMGKPISQSIREIEKCVQLCQYYGSLKEQIDHASHHMVINQPTGILLGISPWNFPLWQALRFAIPSLLSGHVIILKHSPNVQLCAIALERLFIESGFPTGCYQNIICQPQTALNMISNPWITGVSFTGSTRTGKIIAKKCGEHLKPCILELGGSDPFIVLDDADIPHAVEVAIQSRLNNTGQACNSAKRFIIHEKIYDAFKKTLTKSLEAIEIMSPNDPAALIGPLARKDLFITLDKQVQQTIKMGAQVAFKQKTPLKTQYFPIMVLENINDNSPASTEELFGPVFSLFKAQSVDDAIQIANQSKYGLCGTIFSQDNILARDIAHRLQAGSCFINRIASSHVELPFGGIKESGYGRELSPSALQNFCNIKLISTNRK